VGRGFQGRFYVGGSFPSKVSFQFGFGRIFSRKEPGHRLRAADRLALVPRVPHVALPNWICFLSTAYFEKNKSYSISTPNLKHRHEIRRLLVWRTPAILLIIGRSMEPVIASILLPPFRAYSFFGTEISTRVFFTQDPLD
jgi:hypothetical protein